MRRLALSSRTGLAAAGLALSLSALSLAAAPVQAQEAPFSPRQAPGRVLVPPGMETSSTSAEFRKSLVPTVVRVNAEIISDGQTVKSLGPRRSGTGVIIGPDTVLTIGYLLLEAEQVEVVTATGKRIPATVAGYDHPSGFGVVRTVVPLDGQPVELGDSDQISEQQKVLTLGHGEPEATELMVLSRKQFAGSWEYMLERPIFTFPPVNNWSGAALMTAEGKLIGIGSLIVNDAATSQQGVPGNLFVPVNLIKPILNELLANGKSKAPPQPWLGVATEQVRGNLMVVRVTPDSPADSAGLSSGDIILGVNGEKVSGQADFYKHLWKTGPAGTTVPLRVLKDGDVRELPVRSMDRMDFLRKPRGI
ncbi:MAG: serine protease [Burkholderiales bacterium]|nr:serine protease [Burkholderiales bacterium]